MGTISISSSCLSQFQAVPDDRLSKVLLDTLMNEWEKLSIVTKDSKISPFTEKLTPGKELQGSQPNYCD